MTFTNELVDRIIGHYYDHDCRPPAELTDRVMVKPIAMREGDVIRVPQASAMFDTAIVQDLQYGTGKVYLYRPYALTENVNGTILCRTYVEHCTLSMDSDTEFERLATRD